MGVLGLCHGALYKGWRGQAGHRWLWCEGSQGCKSFRHICRGDEGLCGRCVGQQDLVGQLCSYSPPIELERYFYNFIILGLYARMSQKTE